MMTKESIYREGDFEMTREDTERMDTAKEHDNVTQLPTNPSIEQEAAPEEIKDASKRPYVAAMLLQFGDGRVDVVTDLPNMGTHHQATVREVRNMCQSVVFDMNNMIQAKITVNEIQMEGAKRQIASQIEGFKNKLKV
jgi:hypothetical protein